MKQHIFLIGLNYRNTAVDVRERFALTDHCDQETWAIPLGPRLQQGGRSIAASMSCKDTTPDAITPDSVVANLEEVLILSTCNRVEILVIGSGDVPMAVLQDWAVARNTSLADLQPHIYVHTGDKAVHHLFTVASSLDSMVLGEPQILGQLKDAYRKATLAGTTKTIINRMLHKAFSVAKRVRTETEVASSAVSISYAAVELAKRIFGDMHHHKAMLIGAGEMAELAATHLIQAGIAQLLVTNRTFERAQSLATQFNGLALPFEQLQARLSDVDIVITSTGAPEAIIRAKDMKEVLRRRKNRPMFCIDIAVPRDIDPDVNNLDNMYLYDIDDLKEVVEENLVHRRDEADKAMKIVQEEVEAFAKWLRSLSLQPTIVDLLSYFEQVADDELAKTLKRLGSVDETTKEALHIMVRSLVHKLGHDPIMFLKKAHEQQDTNQIHALRQAFNLDGNPLSSPARCPYRKTE